MVIALDIGTSSTRAALYDDQGQAVPGGFHQTHYEPLTTPDGGVEHDPRVLLEAVAASLDTVLARPEASNIRAVGVAAFWHGLVGFDASGRAVTPLLTWADTRAAPDAAALRFLVDESALHARTGCHLHASYWPAKLRWLGRTRAAEVARVARWGSVGELLELTLHGEAATSVSMASGTGLFDQLAQRWDTEALAAAGTDPGRLFPVRDAAEGRRGLRQEWAGRWPALARATWLHAVGDGAAGSVGSDCLDAARIALNVGTSAALRLFVVEPLAPPRGLWAYRLDRRRPLLGGATSEGGNVRAWLRDVLELPDDADLEDALAGRPPDSHGLTVLPFLAGERAPGWRGDRRAAFAGLSLATTAVDLFCAALEAVALRLAAVYDLLAPYAAPGHAIVASGGAVARSPAWTQLMADAFGHPVSWSLEDEATSRGAALLALETVGALSDLAAVRLPLGRTFEPDPGRHARLRAALERQRQLDARV